MGLARLAFAGAGGTSPEPIPDEITCLRVRDLGRPRVGLAFEGTQARARIERLIIRLPAAYTLRLTRTHRSRHCVLGLDDATMLFADRMGRDLLSAIAQRSRASDFAPLVGTSVVVEPGWCEGSFGTVFCLRASDEREAATACRLLGADPSRRGLVRGLLSAGPGRCVMRDYRGNVCAVQIDFADDRLLPLMDTTPSGVWAAVDRARRPRSHRLIQSTVGGGPAGTSPQPLGNDTVGSTVAAGWWQVGEPPLEPRAVARIGLGCG